MNTTTNNTSNGLRIATEIGTKRGLFVAAGRV